MKEQMKNRIFGMLFLVLLGLPFFSVLASVPETQDLLQSPWTEGAFDTGKYRNIFAEMGYSSQEIDARVQSVFDEIFSPENKVYVEPDDSTAYICDIIHDDVRSEGMSYGMMIAVEKRHF